MAHDIVQAVDDIKKDRRAFYLSPIRWRRSKVGFALSWKEVKFDPANATAVPERSGIYAFVVRHANNHFPPHGYIMYIGITGDVGPTRTLRVRYRDYLREKKRDKRPRVSYMLNKYQDDLYFCYVALDRSKVDLGQLELHLNDCILPPVVVKDFTAEVRALVGALRD
jgi:hypothetical protein